MPQAASFSTLGPNLEAKTQPKLSALIYASDKFLSTYKILMFPIYWKRLMQLSPQWVRQPKYKCTKNSKTLEMMQLLLNCNEALWANCESFISAPQPWPWAWCTVDSNTFLNDEEWVKLSTDIYEFENIQYLHLVASSFLFLTFDLFLEFEEDGRETGEPYGALGPGQDDS